MLLAKDTEHRENQNTYYHINHGQVKKSDKLSYNHSNLDQSHKNS